MDDRVVSRSGQAIGHRMILTDDNFASIAAAVEGGRGVFENLTKFIAWTLPTNVGEGLVIPPFQILWINMTTVILLGMTLTFESKEPDLMSRPPPTPNAPFWAPRCCDASPSWAWSC